MAVFPEEIEYQQNVEQRRTHRHVGLVSRVVDLCHGHAHLGVDDLASHLDHHKKQPHHKSQHKSYAQFLAHDQGKDDDAAGCFHGQSGLQTENTH